MPRLPQNLMNSGGEISDMILYLTRRAGGRNRVIRETTADDTDRPPRSVASV